jgi:hypothetical protein
MVSNGEFLHRFLYSVVPVGESGSFRAYLTGYCPNCGKSFSQLIPVRQGPMEAEILFTTLDVPKYGCLAP